MHGEKVSQQVFQHRARALQFNNGLSGRELHQRLWDVDSDGHLARLPAGLGRPLG
jgi:hypothetical protein